MAEVVRRELQLPALRRTGLRQGHDPGVVDQDVQRSVPAIDEGRDRRPVGEVQRCDQDLLVAGGREVAGGALAGVEITDGEGHLGAGARERSGRLDADAGGSAGDDRAGPVRSIAATTSAAVDRAPKGVTMREAETIILFPSGSTL